MKHYWTLFLALSLVLFVRAQVGTSLVKGMANAAALGSGGQCITYEQEADRWVNLNSLKPYDLPVLRVNELGVGWSLLRVVWEMGFIQQGDQVFCELAGYLGASRSLGPHMHLSVTCLFYQRRMTGYVPSRVVPYPDVTILYKTSAKLTVGCRLINPTGSRLHREDGRSQLYQAVHLGLAYELHTNVTCLIEGRREPSQAASLHAGFRYNLADPIALRLGVASPLFRRNGVATYPLQPCFGIETTRKKCHLSVSWQLHAALGATTGVSVRYNIR